MTNKLIYRDPRERWDMLVSISIPSYPRQQNVSCDEPKLTAKISAAPQIIDVHAQMGLEGAAGRNSRDGQGFVYVPKFPNYEANLTRGAIYGGHGEHGMDLYSQGD